jgi:hypothetical protein
MLSRLENDILGNEAGLQALEALSPICSLEEVAIWGV